MGLISSEIPAGSSKDYFGGAVPTGFLLEDGTLYDISVRTDLLVLFGVIGYTYGGSGTMMAVPDTRRRVTIGSGGTAVSGPANTVGSTGGEETHTLSLGEMPTHNHSVHDTGHGHTYTDTSTGSRSGGSLGGGSITTQPTSTATAAIAESNMGGGSAHNNMQPSLVVTKMIKY